MFATANFRTATFGGTPFAVVTKNVPGSQSADSLAKTHHFLETRDQSMPKRFLSPWHEIDLAPSTFQNHHVTGIIEIAQGTTAKMECSKETKHNPVFQDVNKSKVTGLK
jgi:hypothetical protein